MEITFDFYFDNSKQTYFAFCYPWGYIKNQVCLLNLINNIVLEILGIYG